MIAKEPTWNSDKPPTGSDREGPYGNQEQVGQDEAPVNGVDEYGLLGICTNAESKHNIFNQQDADDNGRYGVSRNSEDQGGIQDPASGVLFAAVAAATASRDPLLR